VADDCECLKEPSGSVKCFSRRTLHHGVSRDRHVLCKFRENWNGRTVEESEIYVAEMKVFKSQIKVVHSFHHRTLWQLQEVSRANNSDIPPKAFSGR